MSVISQYIQILKGKFFYLKKINFKVMWSHYTANVDPSKNQI